MIAKCGEVKVWHWAHRGKRICDPWWENETEWHRAWKAKFPDHWQEIVHKAPDGEKHIADVKTDQGWVLEFQHSPISPEERRSRSEFYKKLAWVVDGSRLKNDAKKFYLALNGCVPNQKNPLLRKVSTEKCPILRKWSECMSPVFIDFENSEHLWWMHSKCPDGLINIVGINRIEFIEIHRGNLTGMAKSFDDLIQLLNEKPIEASAHAPELKPAPVTQQTFIPRHRIRARL